jgi:hypothetical protein
VNKYKTSSKFVKKYIVPQNDGTMQKTAVEGKEFVKRGKKSKK